MADWDEIKRLAADFQKIQLTSTTQKLSERNCIEIITWLTERKIIDLIFTVDGKEYLTPAYLVQEIKNELCVNGGRVNLVELAKNIGVDFSHVNSHLSEVLKGQRDLHSILGQLIDVTYINRIAEEINEKLVQQGQVNVSDLTIQYDLPADFLQKYVLERNLNKTIHGKQDKNDPRIFFTENYISRCSHKIKGALNALTKPTPISSILSHIEINEKLFFSLFDDVNCFGFLTSRMIGAQYIPDIYSKSQAKWVNTFFKQNDYVEYDSLIKIGISDYKTYIKKLFPNEELIFLKSCVISKRTLDRVDADLEESIISKSFLNIQNDLPSVFNDKDMQQIIELIVTKQKQLQTIVVGNYVISNAFLENLSKTCIELMKENVKKVVESGKYQQYQLQLNASKLQRYVEDVEEKLDKKEERRKKAVGGKSGGGTQGRETKTKSTKKHYRGGAGKATDVDDDFVQEKKQLEILNKIEIIKLIESHLEDEGLDDLIEPLADYLLPKLNEDGLKLAAELYATTVADRTASARQSHNELQNKLNAMVGDVRLFEKGLKLLPFDIQQQLVKYLLKTICTDIVNEILKYLAHEKNSNIHVENFNNDQRVKFVNDLGAEYKSLLPLLRSLQGQSIDDFMTTIDEGLACCSMIIKKIDKKKDRTIILNHRHQLIEQLNKCEDLALMLHLATIILFETVTQCMLHASGKHISAILKYLKQYLTEEEASELFAYHDFVTLMLSNGSESENAKEKLKEKVSVIRKIANEFKKSSSEKS